MLHDSVVSIFLNYDYRGRRIDVNVVNNLKFQVYLDFLEL